MLAELGATGCPQGVICQEMPPPPSPRPDPPSSFCSSNADSSGGPKSGASAAASSPDFLLRDETRAGEHHEGQVYTQTPAFEYPHVYFQGCFCSRLSDTWQNTGF